jgi:osmotically-inducible protein OsmY
MNQLTKRSLNVAVAAAVLSCTAACSTTPTKTSEQQLADNETAARVRSALAADSHIYTQHVSVQADNGVVELGGYVWNDYDLAEAERIAQSVSGVSQVVDKMELERGGVDNSPVSR